MTHPNASHDDNAPDAAFARGGSLDVDETFLLDERRDRAGGMVRLIAAFYCFGSGRRSPGHSHGCRVAQPSDAGSVRGVAPERDRAILNEHRPGVFACAGCDNSVFSSETKLESGTGWPSFWAQLNEQVIGTTRDTTLDMIRVEVHCSRCGGHLGHVFNDGPKVTGLRYCMNGVAMTFKPTTA